MFDSLEALDSDRIVTLVEYFGAYGEDLVGAPFPEDAAALSDQHRRVSDIQKNNRIIDKVRIGKSSFEPIEQNIAYSRVIEHSLNDIGSKGLEMVVPIAARILYLLYDMCSFGQGVC